MALPTTNITTTMVRSELGETTNNTGALCISPKINMWSKYKPVHLLDTPFHAFTGNWYYGSRNNLGLKIVRNGVPLNGTLMLSRANFDVLNEYVYEYERPEGGVESPYRLGDFRGYNHNARPFIYSGVDSEAHITEVNLFVFEYGYGEIRIGFNINSDAADYMGNEIILEDLLSSTIANFDFSLLHFCCAVLEDNLIIDVYGQSLPVGTVSTPEIYIPIGGEEGLGLTGATYTLQFFLGDGYQIGEDDGTEVQHIFPLPKLPNHKNRWLLEVKSYFPANAKITQIGVLESSFIAGNSSINDSDVDYHYPNYWGGDDGFPDSIIEGAAYYKNICFVVCIDNVKQTFTVRKNTFTGSSSSTGNNKYQAYIQTMSDTYADAASSKTLTFSKGTETYLYIALSNTALFADILNSIQYGLQCKNAHMCLSTWLQLG